MMFVENSCKLALKCRSRVKLFEGYSEQRARGYRVTRRVLTCTNQWYFRNTVFNEVLVD